MTGVGNIVDEVLTGRRFPFSRAWAQAGFSPEQAEEWRQAGWDDPDVAATWHRIATGSDASTLRALAVAGVSIRHVAAVARFAPSLAGAWVAAFHGDLDQPEVDLRETARPRQSHPNGLRVNHPIGR